MSRTLKTFRFAGMNAPSLGILTGNSFGFPVLLDRSRSTLRTGCSWVPALEHVLFLSLLYRAEYERRTVADRT